MVDYSCNVQINGLDLDSLVSADKVTINFDGVDATIALTTPQNSTTVRCIARLVGDTDPTPKRMSRIATTFIAGQLQ